MASYFVLGFLLSSSRVGRGVSMEMEDEQEDEPPYDDPGQQVRIQSFFFLEFL